MPLLSVVTSASASVSVADLSVELCQTQLLEHIIRVLVNDNLVNVKNGDLRNEVHSSLTLLFLQLQGDSSNGTSLNSLHEMRNETGNLVAHTFGRDHSDLITDSLVGPKVESKFSVVLLYDLSTVVFYRFGSNASLWCKIGV